MSNAISEDVAEMFNTFQIAEANRTLDIVLNEFQNYANPSRNVVVEQYIFNSRVQELNEKFDEFVTEQRKLIKYCQMDGQCMETN